VQGAENPYELKESEAFHDTGTVCREATLALLAARFIRRIRHLIKVDETSTPQRLTIAKEVLQPAI
jgi:hypothetical protein